MVHAVEKSRMLGKNAFIAKKVMLVIWGCLQKASRIEKSIQCM